MGAIGSLWLEGDAKVTESGPTTVATETLTTSRLSVLRSGFGGMAATLC
jgi:hypothetical protein